MKGGKGMKGKKTTGGRVVPSFSKTCEKAFLTLAANKQYQVADKKYQTAINGATPPKNQGSKLFVIKAGLPAYNKTCTSLKLGNSGASLCEVTFTFNILGSSHLGIYTCFPKACQDATDIGIFKKFLATTFKDVFGAGTVLINTLTCK